MTGKLTVSIDAVYQGFSGPLTSTGSLYGSVVQQFSRSVSMSGAGTLSGAGSEQYQRDSALSGSMSLGAASAFSYFQTSPNAGDGALGGTAFALISRSSPYGADGSLTGTAVGRIPSSVSLSGAGALSATTTYSLSMQSFTDSFDRSASATLGANWTGATSLSIYNNAACAVIGAPTGDAPAGSNVYAQQLSTNTVEAGFTTYSNGFTWQSFVSGSTRVWTLGVRDDGTGNGPRFVYTHALSSTGAVTYTAAIKTGNTTRTSVTGKWASSWYMTASGNVYTVWGYVATNDRAPYTYAWEAVLTWQDSGNAWPLSASTKQTWISASVTNSNGAAMSAGFNSWYAKDL